MNVRSTQSRVSWLDFDLSFADCWSWDVVFDADVFSAVETGCALGFGHFCVGLRGGRERLGRGRNGEKRCFRLIVCFMTCRRVDL